MTRLSEWPVNKERALRLKKFHSSRYWPKSKDGLRGHDVSQLWLDAVARIQTIVDDDSIKIVSLSSYSGPRQLEEERQRRKIKRQGWPSQAALLAKGIGRFIPRVFWNKVWNPLEKVAHVANEARSEEVTRKAFLKTSAARSDALVTLEKLNKIPVLAQQSESSIWMVLYIASIINVLGPHIRDLKINKIMEIGPGWGVLAISLHQLFGCRFILVDLPEVLSATFAMIQYYSPESVVMLPHEVEELKMGGQGPDFILLCPEQTSLIPSDSMDLAINSSSFQEMTYPLVQDYFRLIKRCLRNDGLFYCLNEKAFKRHRVGGLIEFEKYPWDPDFRDVFYEEFGFGRLSESYERMHRLQVKSVKTTQTIKQG